MGGECVEVKHQPEDNAKKNNPNFVARDSASRIFVKVEAISKMQEAERR